MDINSKLKEIDTEDFIWVIYLGIIFLSFYSNNLERKYYINKDKIAKEKYQKILIFIFAILFIVYLYFLKSSVDSLKKLKPSDHPRKKELVTLSFVAALLITISGFIYLYVAIMDDNLDVELAFN